MSLYFSHKFAEYKSTTYIISQDFENLVEGQNSKGTVYDSVYIYLLTSFHQRRRFTHIYSDTHFLLLAN